MATQKKATPIGLAVIGCGTIGRIRAILAQNYPAVEWLGLCDLNEDRARSLGELTGADFYTTDAEELLSRPEVNATIIATDETGHPQPTLTAIEHGHDLFIEKPLATTVLESLEVDQAIREAGIDAVMGYTQRFRRRYITIKQRIASGAIGEVDSVTTRALLNRVAPESGLARAKTPAERRGWTPMNINGTHTVDLSMWFMEGKTPVEIYARSSDKVLGHLGVNNTTSGIVSMDDGTVWTMTLSVGMPVSWPAAVYGLEIAVVGTRGALTIDDTHRDVVLASDFPQQAGYRPAEELYQQPQDRHVEFLTSYPPGDEAYGQIWGPMREETNSWFARVAQGVETPHATAAEGHRNALLTAAFDLSAARGEPVRWPLDLDQVQAELGG
jgi:predicted dehydrogenase